MSDELGKRLSRRFKHLATELREARRRDGDGPLRESMVFYNAVGGDLFEAFSTKKLPPMIMDAIRKNDWVSCESPGVGLILPVFNYFRGKTDSRPYPSAKGKYAELLPGFISLVWPEVFKPVFWEIEKEYEGEDEREILSAAWDAELFQIFGYYATACDLLAEWIENHADDDHGDQGGDRDAVGSAALGAVVAGGLAGVLQAAVGARATDRVTAVMRQRIANDRTLYGWTQKDWADDLGASTKTISKCDAWREILDWRASNEVDRVSKETGK